MNISTRARRAAVVCLTATALVAAPAAASPAGPVAPTPASGSFSGSAQQAELIFDLLACWARIIITQPPHPYCH
ncbi:hypothetical protein IU433_01290 [Nocardia puris]|uniref:Secreted protein n=1 Tax=Nocardia puris TaxID=208602 RepID=A0A366DX32_9NOCA|nr:hypothetical protein [Nocardia puris]MBF6210419.1 hypothetical protein [Nocardia puris]MBF6367494.1 hypothetical protein [Nocardia puris]MBF6457679.1 hypothetical protein [Nocardia puris]RBO93844.1 hypothetical protein DFR74_102263 [Nocardia puris]